MHRTHPFVTFAGILVAVSATHCSSSDAAPSADTGADTGAADTHVADTGSLDTGSPDVGTDTAPATVTHAVLVIGTLSSADLSVVQPQHDALAKGGEAAAKGAGDVGHAVMLGTTMLGTKKDEFLALDRWIDGKNIDAFYGNPEFAKGFGALFSAPPFRNVYAAQPTWASFGTPDSAKDTSPHYWIIVRGTLKSTDTATNKATHDVIMAASSDKAKAAGDLAHVVFLGRDDPRQFLAIDVWADKTNIETFYGNPELGKAFGALFEGAPTLGVYQSTKWHQW